MAETDNTPKIITGAPAPGSDPATSPAAPANVPAGTVTAQSPAGSQAPLGSQTQQRPCPKDCTKCGFQQHAFCAAKMSFDAFAVMSQMLQRLDAQTRKIDELSARIAAIESAEHELAAPMPIQTELFADKK